MRLYKNHLLEYSICQLCTACVEQGIIPHEGQSRSPMPEFAGPPVTASYAGRDMDPAIRQPYQGQLRPTKPGGHILQFDRQIGTSKTNKYLSPK